MFSNSVPYFDLQATHNHLEGLVRNLSEPINSKNSEKVKQQFEQVLHRVDKTSKDYGLGNLYLGWIYARSGNLRQGALLCQHALKNLPLPQIYDGTKQYLLSNTDTYWSICIQMVVNRLADDGYTAVSAKNQVQGYQDFGVVHNWDTYLTFRLRKKYEATPKATLWLDQKGRMKMAPIALFRSQQVEEVEITRLYRYGQQQKRNGNLLGSKQANYSALAIRPDDNAGYYNLGKICYLTNEIFEAVSSFMRALHLEAGNTAITFNLLDKPRSLTHLTLEQKMRLLVSDPNTPRHLAHVLVDTGHFMRIPQELSRYSTAYRRTLLGDKSTDTNDELEEVYLSIGVYFAIDNLRWDCLFERDVTGLYTDVRTMRFDTLIEQDLKNDTNP